LILVIFEIFRESQKHKDSYIRILPLDHQFRLLFGKNSSMDVIVTDKKGQRFQLVQSSNSKSQADDIVVTISNLKMAQAFLNNIDDKKSKFWSNIQKLLDPKSKTAIDTKSIKENIADQLVNKQLQILRKATKKNQSAAKTVAVAATLGPAVTGKSTSTELYPSSKVTPGNDNALQSTCPSTPATTCNADAETRGCPISVVTGEELLELNDFILPGPMAFVWKRFYRTGHSNDFGLGHGWTHAASEQLVLESEEVIVSDDEGRQLTFARPQLYQRSKLINEAMDLDFAGKNYFILKQQGHNDKVFTRLGGGNLFRLSQIRHSAYRPYQRGINGNHVLEQGYCIDLHYDKFNRLVRLAGNWGKTLKLNRDEQGRIASVVLVKEQNQEQKTVAEYQYDIHGDLTAHRNASGKGETYQYSNHIIIQRTLITGFSYYYKWDTLDNSARCTHNWGDGGIYDYHFTWDPENNASCATDSRGYTTTFVYNEFGQIVHEIDNEGHVHQYEYTHGRKTAYIDPEGNRTDYFYDSNNQASGYRDALNNAQTVYYFKGKPTEFTDKEGACWRRQYNEQGLLKTQIDPLLKETQYKYNKNGLLSQVRHSEGQVTQYRWTQSGELFELIDSQGNKQQFIYNPWGDIVERHLLLKDQEDASITQYQYSATKQLEKITAPNGDVTSYQYNDNNQLIQYSDPQGRITQFEYDGLSQVTKRTNPNGDTLNYKYDDERNLITLINENGESYQFKYDGNERLIDEIGFDGRIQHYHYNKAGFLIGHIDANSIVTKYERDALGQMGKRTTRHIHNQQPAETNTFNYTRNGQLWQVYNQNQFLEFSYDVFGNLEKEHHSDLEPGKERAFDRVASSFKDITFSTTSSGMRQSITLPDGERIEYGYNSKTHRQLESIKYNDKLITQIQHDVFGREIKRYQGQLTTISDYDPMGRLNKQLAISNKNKQNIIHREYGYDEFSNLNFFKNGQHETRYEYDILDRVQKTLGGIQANIGEQIEEQNQELFNFDPTGNILSISEQPESNESEEKISAIKGNRLTMQGDRKFDYDERGNLIRESRGKGGKLVTEFVYNLQNQLIKVFKDGQKTSYKYDPIGRRIAKIDEFGETNYLWAENQLLQETRNNINKTYVYEPNSFKPVAQIQDEQIYHYHLDHLGTPQELTNIDGKVVWKVRYKTYGNVALKETEEIENNIRFQGQYFDAESGLHYNRHRYYNPNTGQFINQDPIGLSGGINNYQYAPNPTGWVDPFGLSCKEVIPENYDPLSDTYTGVDINLFSPNENIHNSAKKVANNANVLVVGAHGNPSLIVDESGNAIIASELADTIRAHPKYQAGMPVDLLSCNTGKGDNPYAQQLAKELNAPVRAPDQYLWYYTDGRTVPAGMTIDNKIDLSQLGNSKVFTPT